ncbi:hypothetical protein CHARACLAT_007073 [Characodon lateralis]|uniref:Uncharacterized protein n=1 Tax=Characodon lateralis TaxID=208331 RepID=A0ABU7D6Q8_9TELE|nr:hypothetical protein [Characodon lateralis]
MFLKSAPESSLTQAFKEYCLLATCEYKQAAPSFIPPSLQLLLHDSLSAVIQPSWKRCTEGGLRICRTILINAARTVSTLHTVRPNKCFNNTYIYNKVITEQF